MNLINYFYALMILTGVGLFRFSTIVQDPAGLLVGTALFIFSSSMLVFFGDSHPKTAGVPDLKGVLLRFFRNPLNLLIPIFPVLLDIASGGQAASRLSALSLAALLALYVSTIVLTAVVIARLGNKFYLFLFAQEILFLSLIKFLPLEVGAWLVALWWLAGLNLLIGVILFTGFSSLKRGSVQL